MSMSNDTVYIPADIEVLPCNDKEVFLTNSIIDITPCESTTIPVRKKEYEYCRIVYILPLTMAPPLVLRFLILTLSRQDHLSEITDANKNLLDAIFALDVALTL